MPPTLWNPAVSLTLHTMYINMNNIKFETKSPRITVAIPLSESTNITPLDE